MKSQVTFGSDPELHLFDNETKRIVSSLRILGRNKLDPIILGDGMKMYADNVLIEAAFPPALAETVVAMIRDVFTRMQEKLGARYSLLPKASHVYDPEELADPACWETGCNPNFDVYAEAMNLPADFKDGQRTGSFHIHVGNPLFDGNKMEMKAIAIRLMDVFVGCASVIFDKDESAPARRSLYGKAGEFRPTSYGAEYRVLGNYPLRSPETTKLVYDLVDYTMTHIHNKTDRDVLKAINPLEVQTAINTNDRTLALKVLDKAALPHKLLARVQQDYQMPAFNQAWSI